MKFDKSKVLSVLSDNNLDYKGWKGYFADSIMALKQYVKEGSLSYDLLHEVHADALDDMTFEGSEVGAFRFFYPVEEPKLKETWRPYRDLTEMIADLMDLHPNGERFSAGSLARILIGTHFLLDGCIYTPTMIDTLSDSLYIDRWVGMNDLLDSGWMFIDVREPEPIIKRCGVKEEE